MTKKKLRRLLRQAHAARDHWRERATTEQTVRRLSEQLIEELRLQIELAPRHEPVEELRRIRELERHVQHHHDLAGKPFTLVRDVNAQTERMLAESRAQVCELEAENYALRYPPEADEGWPEAPDDEPTPELPPMLPLVERRIAPGDVVYVSQREGGVFMRAEVESVRLIGEGGWTRIAELHFKRPEPAPLGPPLTDASGRDYIDHEVRACGLESPHPHHVWDWTPAVGDPTTFYCEGIAG